LGEYNYTTVFDGDSIERSIIVLPFESTSFFEYLEAPLVSRIIVLNTEGYDFLARLFFKDLSQLRFRASKYVDAMIVGGEGEADLPTRVKLVPSSVEEDIEALGWYSGDGLSMPFAAQTNYNGTEIVYVNIYPVIEKIRSNPNDAELLYPILGQVLALIDIDLPKSSGDIEHWNWISEESMAFTEAILSGEVEVESSSISFSPEENIELMTVVMDENQRSRTFRYIKSVEVEGSSQSILSSSNLNISPGRGFYSKVNSNNMSIFFSGSDITLFLELEDGTSVKIDGNSNLNLKISGECTLYVREPYVHVNGESLFIETYAYGSVDEMIKTQIFSSANGQNITIDGVTEFIIQLSDTYSMVRDFSLSGRVSRDPPLILWSELEGLTETFSPLSLIPVFLILIFSYFRRFIQVKIKK
jgi:hypothetical protein